MSYNPAIVWFSLDLRLADNPALERAMARQCAILPIFIRAPEEDSPWSPGAASRWWLHQSLRGLDRSLAKLGSKLLVPRGPTAETLLKLATEAGAESIYWNRRYEPTAMARDAELTGRLRECGIAAESCLGNLLFEPGTILNAGGKSRLFGAPAWRCRLRRNPRRPLGGCVL